MRGCLVDTNVVSELRKVLCHVNVSAWETSVPPEDIYISAISLMEIKFGILKARHSDSAFAEILNKWYETQIKPAFAGRILSADLAVSERCSTLLSLRTRDVADALIGATAYVHGLSLVTRNMADFADCDVDLINPWDSPAKK